MYCHFATYGQLHVELELLCRKRLSRYLYDRYLQSKTYYRLSLDSRVHNADQILTHDVEHLCESVCDLYFHALKPVFDIVAYMWKLSNSMGTVAPATMVGYLLISGSALTK